MCVLIKGFGLFGLREQEPAVHRPDLMGLAAKLEDPPVRGAFGADLTRHPVHRFLGEHPDRFLQGAGAAGEVGAHVVPCERRNRLRLLRYVTGGGSGGDSEQFEQSWLL